MILLSAIVAALTVGMGWTHLSNPETVPVYVIAAGVLMAGVTFLSVRVYVFLRMFIAGYAVITASSFLFGLAAVGLTYLVGRLSRIRSTLAMVLVR